MTDSHDDARYVFADRQVDESTSRQLADDGVYFDQVQAENSVIGFYLLVKIAAIQSMLDGRLTRADTQVFGMILSRLNHTTRTAWPSYELIARETGVSEGQVKRSITNLRHLDYVISKRAGLAGSAHWLVHYSVGPIVSLRTVEMQIEQALSQLRKRPIDGFSNVDPTSYAASAPAKNSFRSGPRLVADITSTRSKIDAVGWAKGGETAPLSSMPKGGKVAPVGGPRGAALRRLPKPTGAISAHSKTNLLTEDSISQSVSARATDDAHSTWLNIAANRVRAVLPGTTASVVRTITASSIEQFAEVLGVTVEQATAEVVEQFTIWRDKRFCGNNAGWEGQLLSDTRKRLIGLRAASSTNASATLAWWDDPAQVAGRDREWWEREVAAHALERWDVSRLGPPPGHARCVCPEALAGPLIKDFDENGLRRSSR